MIRKAPHRDREHYEFVCDGFVGDAPLERYTCAMIWFITACCVCVCFGYFFRLSLNGQDAALIFMKPKSSKNSLV